MTSKVSVALAALTALVSLAANAPGREPAVKPQPVVAESDSASFGITDWLDRAEQELNEGQAAWSQLDFSTLDLSIEAPSQTEAAPSEDTSHALLAFEPLDDPAQIARLAALNPMLLSQMGAQSGFNPGGFGPAGVGSGRAKPSGHGNHSGTPGAGSGNIGDGPKPDSPSDTGPVTDPTSPVTDPETGPEEGGGPGTDPDAGNPADGGPVFDPGNGGSVAKPPVTVPEPGSIALLGMGLVGLMLSRRRRPEQRARSAE